MANEKRRAKRGAYKVRSGKRARAQDEDKRLKLLEQETQHSVEAIEAVLAGGTADIDEPLAAMRKLAEEAPDGVRLESRFFARFAARMELEDWAARVFLSGVLPAVMRALRVVAAAPSDLRDRAQFWLDAQDQARLLGEQLLAFCAAREISSTEWPEGSSFIDRLRDRDKAALIEQLQESEVMVGGQKFKMLQRDACAVVGVSEDYTANVRRRHKNPVKKTG
jgi:hypothetical protein